MNIRTVLEKMIAARASDLHLKAGTPPVVRVDGVLYTLDEPAPPRRAARGVPADAEPGQRAHFASHHEIDFGSASRAWRVSRQHLHQRGTPALALRHVPSRCPRSRTWACRR
jgi:twitching motility protein PilT